MVFHSASLEAIGRRGYDVAVGMTFPDWVPRSGWAWVFIAYGAMSVATFIVYGIDKSRARRGAWRISESALHVLELLCGWPGALAAQRVFRHKRQKARFYLVTWLVVATHVSFWTWWGLRA